MADEDIKPGDTVHIDMGAEKVSNDPTSNPMLVRWHNSDFVGPVPAHACIPIGDGGSTVQIDMGAILIGYTDASRAIAMVRWHNDEFPGPVPVHAFTKVMPVPARTGMPRTFTLDLGGGFDVMTVTSDDVGELKPSDLGL